MSKVVLITGAFGFVGSNLSAFLFDKGYELWALDLGGPLTESQRAQSVYGNCFTWEQLAEIPWSEIYAVVHLAGKAHDTNNTSDSQSYFDVNVGLTKRVLELFSRKGAKAQREKGKFVLFSSVKAVADRVEGVLSEDAAPDPQTPYGQSKLEAERLLQPAAYTEAPACHGGCNGEGENEEDNNSRIRALSHLRTYILRPCMIHGPGNKGNLNLLYNIVRKGIPWPLGAYENQRSFASIENVCAVVSGLLGEDVESGIYQIADDEPLSTNRLIEMMAECVERKARISSVPQGFVKALAKVGDLLRLPLNSERLKKLTESYVVSNAKIKKALGWDNMPVSAEEGMRRTLKSFAHK